MKLLTAGCGISQRSFPNWPTWVKYPTVTHSLEHVNVGGPASGNEFICHSVIENLQGVDCAIVVWTNYLKTDIYVESQKTVDEIKTYPTRNFVLNNKGLVVDHAPAWWPSSVTSDNRIKKWLNENVYSQEYQLKKTLISISGLQRALEMKKVDYYMFLGYDIPLQDAGAYGIDLSKFVTLESLYDNYFTGPWKNYSTTKEYGLVPVAGWHWDFYKKKVMPILDSKCEKKQVKIDKITSSVNTLTQKNFENGLS